MATSEVDLPEASISAILAKSDLESLFRIVSNFQMKLKNLVLLNETSLLILYRAQFYISTKFTKSFVLIYIYTRFIMKKVNIEDIPLIPIEVQENVLDRALSVLVDGEKAKIFISQRDRVAFNGDDKIVIVWDKPNEIHGKDFTTKYFFMKEPSILRWGHENDFFTIIHLED